MISREAVRGGETAIFGLMAENMTTKQWAEWLKAPLEVAADLGDLSLSHKLVGAGAEVGNALHIAIRRRHEEAMKYLLENVAPSLDAKDEYDHTPLHVALRSAFGPPAQSEENNVWCEQVVRLLLREGADPNVMGQLGTPLHYACFNNLLGATKALLQAGADFTVGSRGYRGSRSALGEAARSSSADLVKALIEYGADVMAYGPDGNTPLHHAAFSQIADVGDVLIAAGRSSRYPTWTARLPCISLPRA